MRILLLFLGATLGLTVSAQKRLPASTWCALGKTANPYALAHSSSGGQFNSGFNLLHTDLHLTVNDDLSSGNVLEGYADLYFLIEQAPASDLCLDLLPTADSVMLFRPQDGQPYPTVNWQQASGKVCLALPSTPDGPKTGDTLRARIHYHADPLIDFSGWGGLYAQGPYLFNLGVGFAADPHNFGRAWMPCLDQFKERCTFRFTITTPADRPAFCNGALIEEDTLPAGQIRRIWALNEAIPSYLACLASGPYASYKTTLNGSEGKIPVEIAVAPADSNKLKASFVHLPEALAAFEYWYGPFRWNKIGYSIVPFNQGAMEHATNIAYMRDAVDGTTNFETLMAHELSHHWWGDLATCSTAGDMWLNEGWAVYSEHLFLEHAYGENAYREVVRENFQRVLENTHVQEGGYRAVSGLPHDLTYGQHVYNKGAVVAHNLRGYLGDSLFRSGLHTVLANNQFADWSSDQLRDQLSVATGYDLIDFFDDWVFQPGFAHFSLDSVQTTFSPVDGPTEIRLFVKQKRRGATHFYQNVPLEFTVVNPFGQRLHRSAVVSGEQTEAVITVPAFFVPVRVWVNTRQHLTLARADRELLVDGLNNYNFSPAKWSMKITSLPADSALIRVEHHYAMPDTAGNANPGGFRLTNRYWTVDALQAFSAEASLIYDGKGKLDQLDAELFAQSGPSEDSLVLLFRPGPGTPWQEHPGYAKNTAGSTQDRFGLFQAIAVFPGQYTIAKRSNTVGTNERRRQQGFPVTLTPNPAVDRVVVSAPVPLQQIRIVNSSGDTLLDQRLEKDRNEITVKTAGWPAGIYWVWLTGQNGEVGASDPLVVHR